ncbi:MAG: thiamine diphosphokinase [Sedimentibacter sp.]|uniref:thiamine diphosphokinase n=1 Tax=Sedimentibacter sp. TaxID=1960295 RepID=UPI002980BFAE|nr:thiamine diphosphokinase [Sedimentibacter sp.]MDW5299058.1 thiamine diphosphokinase [Sedimentibacter sp.]
MIALIIANGDDVDKSLIKNMHFDCVICADGGLGKAERLGVVPNIILGDFDSVEPSVLEKYRSMNVEIEKFPTEKDYTDMELSIEFALKLGYNNIILVGATGGPRLDHSIANIMLLEKYFNLGVNIEIIDNNNKIQIISDNTDLYLNHKENYFISIVPVTYLISGLTLEGFKYPLDNVIVKRGSTLCISNEIIKDRGRILLNKGIALLFVSKD